MRPPIRRKVSQTTRDRGIAILINIIIVIIIIIIILVLVLTVIITITTVINFNRYLLKRLNTIFEKLLVLRFTTCYKIRQSVFTIYDSLDYYTSRQHVITIYDRCVITIHDTCYNISRQVLRFTTSVITIHDRYYNSRQVLQFTTGITIHDIITFHDTTGVTRQRCSFHLKLWSNDVSDCFNDHFC